MKQLASNRTKQCRIRALFFGFLHILFMVGPLLFFVPYAFAMGEVVSKVALGLTSMTSLILLLISFLTGLKHRAGLHRSIVWLLIAGVLFCLKNVAPFVWIMAVTSILDELVFIRAKDHFQTAYNTNREIDRRGV